VDEVVVCSRIRPPSGNGSMPLWTAMVVVAVVVAVAAVVVVTVAASCRKWCSM